jgi:DNA-directed RNA polymerase subunit K
MEDKTIYTRFEKARIIGARGLQIAMGAPFTIDLKKIDLERMHYNPIEIAKLEFEKGVIPIDVRRPFPEVKDNENLIISPVKNSFDDIATLKEDSEGFDIDEEFSDKDD